MRMQVALVLLLAAPLALAAEGKGAESAKVCFLCHGKDGESHTSAIPKLAGQNAAYIVRQLTQYRDHKRPDGIMEQMASKFTTEQEMKTVAAYFAAKPRVQGVVAKPEAAALGKEAFAKYGCAQCHGEGGMGRADTTPPSPLLAGQNKNYLIKRLTDFQNGQAADDPANPMPGVVKPMNIVDIFAVAEYLSGL